MITLSLLLVSGWFGETGSGHKIHNQRPLKDFARVVTRGDIDIEVGEGEGYAVDVFIDDNLQSSVLTEVKDGTLSIAEKSMLNWKGNAKISITLPALLSAETNSSSNLSVATRTAHDVTLTTSGSGDIRFAGPVKNLTAQTHGSGDYVIAIFDNAENITLRTHGSGDFVVSGKAKQLDVQSMGSGDVDARKLEVARAAVTLYGSGDLAAFVTEEVTHVELHGSGDFTLHGKAKLGQVSVHGSGEIRQR